MKKFILKTLYVNYISKNNQREKMYNSVIL